MHSISQLYGFTISRYSTSPISNFHNPIVTLPALVATMIRATHTRTHYTDDDTDTPSQPSRTLLVNRRLQKERSQSLEVRPRKKSDRAPSLTAPSHTRVTVARYSNCHDSCIRQVRTRAKPGQVSSTCYWRAAMAARALHSRRASCGSGMFMCLRARLGGGRLRGEAVAGRLLGYQGRTLACLGA